MPKTNESRKKAGTPERIELTEEEFNKLVEDIVDNSEPVSDWFPSSDEIDNLMRDLPDKATLDFCIWITESNPEIFLDEEQREGRKRLRKAILDSITFKD